MDLTLNKIDRILRKINFDREIAKTDDPYSEYYWNRRKVEYIVRLMYAVTVDMVLKQNPEKVNKVLIDVKNGTLGAYVTSAEGQLIAALPEEMREHFKDCWRLIDELKKSRNIDAHVGTTRTELRPFIDGIIMNLEELEKRTGGMYFSVSPNTPYKYSYLLVPSNVDYYENGEDIYCRKIDQNCEILPIKVSRKNLQRGNDIISGQLYLYVETPEKVYFYRLSPFIELEDNMNELYSSTMFMGVVQYWNNAVKIERSSILEHDNEKLFKDCLLTSLIPKTVNKNPFFHSVTTKTGKYIDINISNYPGYSDITSSDFRYCCEICSAVEKAEKFCIRRPESYQILCGDGGVGKTTLVFYLIHDVILTGKTGFSKIIFLSAKKYFQYTDKGIEDGQQEMGILPDINNYQDFLDRLVLYFYDKEAVGSITETELINRINGKDNGVSIPNTFLVVDDLDTFLWEDQCKVVDFLKQINPKKMNVLITTRNGKTNGYQIPLTLLDEKHSLLFLRWCLNQERTGADRYMMDHFDSGMFFKYTEGRPLDIKLWSNLMIRGLNAPQKFDIYWTKKQKTMYLYQTTLNQLSTLEQQLYRLLCGISECYEKIHFEMGIPVSLINYLYPNNDLEEIRKMLQVLEDVKLITVQHEMIFMSDIDYLELLNNLELADLSDGLKNVLEDIRAASNRWIVYCYKERLLKYLMGRLGMGENSYEKGILTKMDEDRENLGETEKNLVKELLQKYASLSFPETKRNGLEIPTKDKKTPDKEMPAKEKEISAESEVGYLLQELNEEITSVIDYINSTEYDETTTCARIEDIYRRYYDLNRRTSTAEEKETAEMIKNRFLINSLMDFLG